MNFEPPKNLYTHKWYVRDGSEMLNFLPMIRVRIDATRSRLQKLESALGKMYDIHIFFKVGAIRSNIGVWSIIKRGDEYDNAVLMYPKMKRSTGGWDGDMFGTEKKEGYYLVMLSPECVEWLNKVSHWVGE